MKAFLKITCLILACIFLLALFGKLDISAWEKPWDHAGGNAITPQNSLKSGNNYIEELSSHAFSSEEPESGKPYELSFYQVIDKEYYESLLNDYGADFVTAYMLVAKQDTLPEDGEMTEEAFKEAGTVYTKNQVEPVFFDRPSTGEVFYLLRYNLEIPEEDYGKRYVAFGQLKIMDGTKTMICYSSEIDPKKGFSFPSVAFIMETSETGIKTPNLQLFTNISRPMYDSLVAKYGSEYIRLEVAVQFSRFAVENNKVSYKVFHEKYSQVADSLKVLPEAFASESKAICTFGGSINSVPFAAYKGGIFPFGFLEVTDDNGNIIKRVYGTTEVLYESAPAAEASAE